MSYDVLMGDPSRKQNTVKYGAFGNNLSYKNEENLLVIDPTLRENVFVCDVSL